MKGLLTGRHCASGAGFLRCGREARSNPQIGLSVAEPTAGAAKTSSACWGLPCSPQASQSVPQA